MKQAELHKFSAKQVLDIITGKAEEKDGITVLQYIEDYYSNKILSNTQLTPGTKRNYKKANTHLKRFVLKLYDAAYKVRDLNYRFAQHFKDFLLSNDLQANKRGLTQTSATGNITKFRTIFEEALKEGLIQINPFKQVKLVYKSPLRDRLNITHVKSLFQLNLESYPTQRIYRDMFLFSVFTGLAFTDAEKLTYSHLIKTEDSEIKMSKSRNKTGELQEVVLSKYALEIVKKYEGSHYSRLTGCVLPKRSNTAVNIQAKNLAALAAIPFNLTHHIARHSFRQLLGEAGIESDAVIKRMMGHKRGGSDAVYYTVTESSLIEAKRKLELYLDKHLSE
jgi:integrase/recombinase XerD